MTMTVLNRLFEFESCARHLRGLVEGVAEEVNETV